jgi:mannosyltransferase OCH1-like enzyme
MRIHQILVNDQNKLPNKIPEFHSLCINQIKKLYPNEEYQLYSGEELEEIIKLNFDNDVYKSYQKLRPYAYKSDLGRLCLLYLYGGLYLDLNLFFIKKIPNLNKFNFFAFRDKSSASEQYWSVCNGIIFSTEKHRIIEKYIDLIVKNCKNEFYGLSPICVSGPVVLGTSIILTSPHPNISTRGQMDYFTIKSFNEEMQNKIKNFYLKEKNPNLYKKNNCNEKILEGFIMDKNDEIIALKKPSHPGNIESLGFSGVNNYTLMWEKRLIYDSKIKF